MPSPLGNDHGEMDQLIGGWLLLYRTSTPGIRGSAGVTTILSDKVEVQPDQILRIDEHRGGASKVVGGYLHGSPELVVEVGRSTRAFDLGAKRRAYECAGVSEYLVVCIDPKEIHWFALRDGAYIEHSAGDDGVYRSTVFPGLWLDGPALLTDNTSDLLATLRRGLATPEHAAFRDALADRN
ncbi:MAG: Uma2 family endonuclease [Isosphaeraceae bacterium]